MIESLRLSDVGPAREWSFAFAPRMNLLTGDNGLGKTFLLDVLWFVHTWTWAGGVAWPSKSATRQPVQPSLLSSEISAQLDTGFSAKWSFAVDRQEWAGPPAPASMAHSGVDGVVLYSRADGSFRVWDAARNVGRHFRSVQDLETRLTAYSISPAEVWDGPEVAGPRPFNGLIYDWVRWQQSRNGPWSRLVEVLTALSGEGVEALRPGEPTRVSVTDARDIPTLLLPYGEVPVTRASAGMRRIVSLAYMIVWAWYENKLAAEFLRVPPARSIVLLLDEVETHLHPAWQRRLLPALLRVLSSLNEDIQVQVFASTHSPMVMASVEALFDERIDDLHHFSMDGGVVSARELPFAKQGDVATWLVSEAFGLSSARSLEAERAIGAAMAWRRGDVAGAREQLGALGVTDQPGETSVELALRAHLSAHDPFWVQWLIPVRAKPRP